MNSGRLNCPPAGITPPILCWILGHHRPYSAFLSKKTNINLLQERYPTIPIRQTPLS